MLQACYTRGITCPKAITFVQNTVYFLFDLILFPNLNTKQLFKLIESKQKLVFFMPFTNTKKPIIIIN